MLYVTLLEAKTNFNYLKEVSDKRKFGIVDFKLDDKCKSPVKGRKEKKGESQATFRQLRRTNTIIEAVRFHKVIHRKNS